MRLLISVLAISLLSACATMSEDGKTQRIYFDIAAMQKARCWAYNTNGSGTTHAYDLYVPGSYVIERTDRDLIIDCMGLEGIETTMTVPAHYNERGSYNVMTLGIGTAVDAASEALYAYPDSVLIDFTEAVLEAQSKRPQPSNVVEMSAPSEIEEVSLDDVAEDISAEMQEWSDDKFNEIQRMHQQYNPDVVIKP